MSKEEPIDKEQIDFVNWPAGYPEDLANKVDNETTKARNKKKLISPDVPLVLVVGVLIGSIGGGWLAVLTAFFVGTWIGYLYLDWSNNRKSKKSI